MTRNGAPFHGAKGEGSTVKSAASPQLADAAIAGDSAAENGTAANPPATGSDAVAATANQRAKSIWNYLPAVFDRYSARNRRSLARTVFMTGCMTSAKTSARRASMSAALRAEFSNLLNLFALDETYPPNRTRSGGDRK
jgi:hypothetical protein